MSDNNETGERAEALKIWKSISDEITASTFDESIAQDIRFMDGTMGDGLVARLEHCLTNWWRLSLVRQVLLPPTLSNSQRSNQPISPISSAVSIERISMEVIRKRLLNAISTLAECFDAKADEQLNYKNLRKDCVRLWRHPDRTRTQARINTAIALLRDYQQEPFSILSEHFPFEMQPSIRDSKKRRTLKVTSNLFGVATGIRKPTRKKVWCWDQDRKKLTVVAKHFARVFVYTNGKSVSIRTVKRWSKDEGWSIPNPKNGRECLVLKDRSLKTLMQWDLLSD